MSIANGYKLFPMFHYHVVLFFWWKESEVVCINNWLTCIKDKRLTLAGMQIQSSSSFYLIWFPWHQKRSQDIFVFGHIKNDKLSYTSKSSVGALKTVRYSLQSTQKSSFFRLWLGPFMSSYLCWMISLSVCRNMSHKWSYDQWQPPGARTMTIVHGI